jgi:hypothetical protein
MSVAIAIAPEESLKENEKKWTKTLMAAGWTAIPSVILERQKAFQLDAIDVNILLHLASHWWFASELPYPGKRSVADAMTISPRTVQRRIAKMEHDGLIKRVERWHPKYGRQTNYYDFAGLIKEATPYAQEILEAREKAREEKRDRRSRKLPRSSAMKIAK